MCLENKDWDEAEGYLQELIERDSYVDAAHLNLGRIHEERHDPAGALDEYALVGPGPDYLPAQLRQADILIANGRGSDASRLLAEAREAQPDYAIQLFLIESESYSNNNKDAQANQVLQQAIQRYPDDLNLLYTRAMLAEKRNDLTQMEKDLRAIIAREPENAMALNALGYTLADRTTRYAEAKALIDKAHQLTPMTRQCSTAWVGSTIAWATSTSLKPTCARPLPTSRPRSGRPPGRSTVGQRQAPRSSPCMGQGLRGPGRQPYPAQDPFAPDRIETL